MITKTKLEYWRRLCAEATPGPWSAGTDCVLAGDLITVAWASSDGTDQPAYLHYRSHADRSLVLAAPEAIRALLAERDAFLARLRELGVALAPSRDEQDEAEWQIAQRER